jgi:hypothetical protein
MKLVDQDETVVVVTGASAEGDTAVARWLQQEIDRRGAGMAYRRAVVIGDERYVQTPGFHQNPTITIGGPGANGVAQHLTTVLPMIWSREDRMFVQMGLDGQGRQVALWGMDAEATRGAVEAFVEQGLLDALLDRVWTFRPRTTV